MTSTRIFKLSVSRHTPDDADQNLTSSEARYYSRSKSRIDTNQIKNTQPVGRMRMMFKKEQYPRITKVNTNQVIKPSQ